MDNSKILRHMAVTAVSLMSTVVLWAQDYSVYYETAETKEHVFETTASVSGKSGKELYKTTNSNLTNAFFGIPGLTLIQGNGEIGSNGARYLVRGIGSYGVGDWNTAKIFVDGFEVNMEYLAGLTSSEIESVQVLKDGAALSIYGEKGANGVILITTRRGEAGKMSVSAQVRSGVELPNIVNKPLNSYDFANLYNQAVSNDNGMTWTPAYSQAQLDAYKNGSGVDVDWYNEALKKTGQYTDVDLILNGGTKNIRYNVNFDYLNNSGIMNTKNTDVTKNLGYQKFNLRTNLDFNILKIFEVKVDVGGRIEMLRRPNYSVSGLFSDLSRYPSNIYNVFDDEKGENYSGTAIYNNNPYASVNALGWAQNQARSLQGNFTVKERLDMIAEGLYLIESFSFYNYTRSSYSKTRNYARWFNGSTTTTDQTTTITASGWGSDGMQDWKQGRVGIGYENSFGKHNLSLGVNWNISAYKGDGYFSYKYNTMNLNALLHYDYADRYVIEAGYSYFGNDAYAPGNRWASYPAVSAAWVISNENFLKDNDVVQLLKLRASAGLTGYSDSDATSVLSGFSSYGRYLFKDYYTYSYTGSFYTGKANPQWQTSLVPMFIKNENIHAEKSLKYNVGLDMILGNEFSFTADAFLDKRFDILTLDNSLVGYYGKQYYFSNIGRMTNYGFEISADWTRTSGDFTWGLNGQVSFARNRIDYMAEVPVQNQFSARTGRPLGTFIGLVADGFYGVEDYDDNGKLVEGLPHPSFGSVQPGDIKYLDLDKNGIVDQNDVTRIGRSYFPEWSFSFGGHFGYKGFDLSLVFQGVAGVSANLLDNWNQTVAFVDNGNAFPIAKSAWAYYPGEGIDTRTTAKYPRLTTLSNENNYRTSSFWIKDGSYLKLRTVEIGYNFATGRVKEAGISNLRIFLNGNNLFTISTLQRDWSVDPENLQGLYPTMKTITAGLSITF